MARQRFPRYDPLVTPDSWFLQHLACPDCRRDLAYGLFPVTCVCGFTIADASSIDFRPQRPEPRTVQFTLGGQASRDLSDVSVDRPPLTYSGPRALRDSAELFSAAEPWLRPGAALLDLGCGPRDQAGPAAHYGLRYVGIDYTSAAADLLADGHALPFRPDTFEAILSYAVLEHLYNPFVALEEVMRVLKPGGIFFGTVSQGEPFHDSYFHHTAWGVLAVMQAAGLRVSRLWPSYDTLHALSGMGRYPRAQRLLIEAVHRVGTALPILAPRKFFSWSKRERQIDELHRGASLCFVAEKLG
jgi:SAM-dependent methyltransferase